MTPPTRGDARLDLIFSNFGEYVSEIRKTEPLESAGGIRSDHDTLVVNVEVPHKHKFRIIKSKSRPMTPESRLSFTSELSMVDWSVIEDLDPSVATECFNMIIAELIDKHFPEKTFTSKTSDDPWITQGIKKNKTEEEDFLARRPIWPVAIT